MSNFKEILSKPLPSKSGIITEGTDCCENTPVDPMEQLTSVLDPAPAEDDTAIDPTNEQDPVVPETPTTVPNDDNVELSPEESKRVDDTMDAVATPILLKSELTEEEMTEFVESADADIAEAEGFLTEKTIIKFDKNAKKAQLYEIAVASVAREKKDPLYKKLQTVYKMERIIKAKLRKKYHAPAQQKVKEYLARAKKSKSSVLSKIINKITGK